MAFVKNGIFSDFVEPACQIHPVYKSRPSSPPATINAPSFNGLPALLPVSHSLWPGPVPEVAPTPGQQARGGAGGHRALHQERVQGARQLLEQHGRRHRQVPPAVSGAQPDLLWPARPDPDLPIGDSHARPPGLRAPRPQDALRLPGIHEKSGGQRAYLGRAGPNVLNESRPV